jgi:plasmid replication initiation protein
MKTNNLINIDNKLAQSSYHMTLNEQRLLFILLSKVKPTEYLVPMTTDEVLASPLTLKELEATKSRKKEFGDTLDAVTLHTISVREFSEFCGSELNKAREDLLEVGETLFHRYIHVKHEDDKSFIKFRWVSSIRFDAKEDTISLRWSIDILPYITQLASHFTKLRLDDLLGLQSTYSWKLYMILKSHKGENNFLRDVVIKVEDLIFELAVPESCKEFKMLNSRILQRATRELQKKALPDLKMELVKKGKKVESVKWIGVPTTRFMDELVKAGV